MKDQMEQDFQELSRMREEYEAMGRALDSGEILSEEGVLSAIQEDLRSVTGWYRDQWVSSFVSLLIFALLFFKGKDLLAHHVMLVLMAILLIKIIVYFMIDRTLIGIGLTHVDLTSSSRRVVFIQRLNRISDIVSFILYLLMAIAIAIEFGLSRWGTAFIIVVFIILGAIEMKETILRNSHLKSALGRMNAQKDK